MAGPEPVYNRPQPVQKPTRDSTDGRKRAAVCGGGLAGICTARNLIAVGIEPIIFDQNPKLGGLWNFNPDVNSGYMYQSCCVNSNRQSLEFPDHHYPETEPDYPRHPAILRYLDTYVEKFDLYRYACLRSKVIDASETSPGSWRVTYESLDGYYGRDYVNVDYVVVCTGQTTRPFMPQYPGIEEFEGEIMHAAKFRSADRFHGKKVLIVGMGTATGCDISQEISFAASHTSVSVRRGMTLLPRYLLGINRWDWFAGAAWVYHFGLSKTVNKIYMFILDSLYYCMYGDLKKIGLRKFSSKVDSKQSTSPICTDACAFPQRVKLGYIKMRGPVKRYTRKGVEFANGEYHDFDTVIFATGYHREIPFTVNKTEFSFPDTPLYKYTFNPSYKNMAFALFMKTVGPQFPVCWFQSRWVAQVFSGQRKLPPAEAMLKSSKAQTRHHGIGGLDPFDTCDLFMDAIGYPRPSNWQLFGMMFTRPTFVIKYLFSPRWALWVPAEKLCPPISKYPKSSMERVGGKMTVPIGSTVTPGTTQPEKPAATAA
uniref:Flavin-containing monooxygenase n=1 Tax=Tetraselmis sp. GSL018 TaxID=582737 RepID=A0A061QU23_9CHLO